MPNKPLTAIFALMLAVSMRLASRLRGPAVMRQLHVVSN
jgi:hypothetical protein